MDAIEEYIDTKLDQGYTLTEISTIFKSHVLPHDLADILSVLPEEDVRLCAQRAISIRRIKAFDRKGLSLE
jgi:hypothetical protein